MPTAYPRHLARRLRGARTPPTARASRRRIGHRFRPALLGSWLAVSVLAACGWDSGEPDAEYGFPPVLLSAVRYHSGDHLIAPGDVDVVGNTVLITEAEGSKNIHVVDRETGDLETSVGDVGRGPGEFLSALGIAQDVEGRPWILDLQAQRITRLDLSRLSDSVAWAPEQVAFDSAGQMISFAWLSDSTVLGSGVFDRGRFAVLGMEGEPVRIEERVDDAPTSHPTPRQLHLSRVAARPDLTRVAAAKVWFDEVSILDGTGRVVATAATPFDRTPQVLVENGVARISDETRNAYAGIATTRDHIYALFSNRSEAEHGVTSGFGRDIHVFDWDGRFVTVLRLDRDALELAVDEEHGHLYTVEHYPAPAILRYALPARLTSDDAGGG